ncbi:MAG TPA: cytochrome c [Candidatus Binataceae bacterium]|nr:cytochrome c [Candidatus Binataceae bacterium]
MTHKKVATALVFIAAAATGGVPLAPAIAQAQDAAAIYAQRCVGCHGANGKGDGPAGKYLNPKPTDFAVSLKGKSDDWIAKVIKGGGAAVGESPTMPPGSDLSDDQVKGLVDYVKHFNP